MTGQVKVNANDLREGSEGASQTERDSISRD